MSAMADLDASLQALLALKAPGITKSRIAAIMTFCVENIKSESVIVLKIFTHFKRTPATHKLGVLYVYDAVIRQWIEKAASAGQDLSAGNPQDGSFAAGVQKMNELLPTMMTDLINTSPYDQQDKITKLVDIWQRGKVFPVELLSDLKQKIEARKSDPEVKSETVVQPDIQASQQPAQTTSELLASLVGLLSGTNNSNMVNTTTTDAVSNGSAHTPVSASAGVPALASSTPTHVYPNDPAVQHILDTAGPDLIPPHVRANAVDMAEHAVWIAQLHSWNLDRDKWAMIINAKRADVAQKALQERNVNPAHGQVSHQPQTTRPAQTLIQNQYAQAQPLPISQHQHHQFATHLPIEGPPRVAPPPGHSPVRRRDSPVYDAYQGNNTNTYRQRTPPTESTRATIGHDQPNMSTNDSSKWVDYDANVPTGNVKVLSRTLFIGGMSCTEAELRQIFSAYGTVQSCIATFEKRHCFIKYTNRAGAVTAREAFGDNITAQEFLSKFRSVKWGVGFGPRECNDYTTGISVIPIDRLTDADRKWVLTAQYGGSGGRPIVSGLVFEEPDIEIGAGVSSKAISRRVAGAETVRPRNGNEAPTQQPHYQDHSARRGGGDRNAARRHRSRSPVRSVNAHAPPNYEPKMSQASAMATYGLPAQAISYYGLPPAQLQNPYPQNAYVTSPLVYGGQPGAGGNGAQNFYGNYGGQSGYGGPGEQPQYGFGGGQGGHPGQGGYYR